jgi:3-hydroxybutyryl-CoA dehydrogenase
MLSGHLDHMKWNVPVGGRVAVLGAGLMGHGIAAVFASNGYRVECVESERDLRESLAERMHFAIETMGVERADQSVVAVERVSDLDPLTSFVIEAVPEELNLKRRILASAEEACPSAILASNTSVYRVGDVGELLSDRSRMVGTHWWNPPHLIPVVEVIQGADTNPSVLACTIGLLKSVGKIPVHVRHDTPGFIGNRMQHALWREAMSLVQEGVCDAADVDTVVRNTIGLRLSAMGPLENADYVGLDLTESIHEYIFPSLSTAQRPLKVLDDFVASGNLGAKTGSGFFTWSEGRREEARRCLADRIQCVLAVMSSVSVKKEKENNEANNREMGGIREENI